MKLRLEGTRNEINWAYTLLKNTPEIVITDESKFYQNRDSKTFRQYLEVRPRTSDEMPQHWKGSNDLIQPPQPEPWDAVLGGEEPQ